MKRFTLILLLFCISCLTYSQKIDYNEQKGFIAGGYDVVSYFSKKATVGSKMYQFTYDGAKYKFSSKTNLEIFKNNPEKYKPQYGGWCAYALSSKNEKVNVNPETYEIRNGKLYLFYNSFFNNTHESWVEENPTELIKKANKNWVELKIKD